MFGLITIIVTVLDWLVWNIVSAGMLSRRNLADMILSQNEMIALEVTASILVILLFLVLLIRQLYEEIRCRLLLTTKTQ